MIPNLSLQKINLSFYFLLFQSSTSLVIFICASSFPNYVSSNVTKHERFDREIIFKLPSYDAKKSMLESMIHTYSQNLSSDDIESLIEQSRGYTFADLKSAVDKALSAEKYLSLNSLRESMLTVVPSFLKDTNAFVQPVYWDDIYGYESVKKEIRKIIDSKKLRGILLYGPPGCSKTMLVRAIATESKFTFLPIRTSTLLSKYVGETEKSIKSLFKKASMSAPSLIFMDELDNLCADREMSQGTGVVTEFLSWVQKTCRDGNVFVVGATNRPNSLDKVRVI